MSDGTTREQRDAENAVDEAVKRLYRAYDGALLPTHWIVCLAVHGADDESGYSDVVPMATDGLPHYLSLGMLRSVTLKVESRPEDAP